MKKFLKILLITLIIISAGAVTIWFLYLRPSPPPISSDDRARLQLMPIPTEMEYENGALLVTENFGMSFALEPNQRIKNATDRFLEQLTNKTGISFRDPSGEQLHINQNANSESYPKLGQEESYEITISDSEISLNAANDIGIIYGLETLLQLLEWDSGQWYFPALRLTDKPRYPWRGLMIDVSRHWIPKSVILRNLDAMAKLKMNVFHWHLSDYQGFRVESKKFPKLHELGSQGNYYSQNDIREIVDYAADRGIRIVPEFDVPGHTTSWLVGYPELGSAPGPYKIDTLALGVFRPVMDPGNPEVYNFLDEFVAEMVTLFPDEYFHIGGDEVMPKDWDENEHIRTFMVENNLKDSHELQVYFNERMRKIISKHGKIMMGWDEIQHPVLPSEGIAIQVWRNHKYLWEAAKRGNKTILSKGYYLDHKKSADEYYQIDPVVIKGAINMEIDSTYWTSWKSQVHFGESTFDGNIYTFGNEDDIKIIMDFMGNATGIPEVQKEGNKINFTNQIDVGKMEVSLELLGDSLKGQANVSFFDLEMTGTRSGGSDMPNGLPLPRFDKIEPLTKSDEENILGGEACMWTEMVDSITLESRIWPKAAAIAEKLWSPQELTSDNEDMYRRLMIMNNKLESIGLHHHKNQAIILKNMVGDAYVKPFSFLVDYLHEGAFANRIFLYEPELYTSTPLDLVVDAASAESYPAYEFNKTVDLWLNTKDEKAKEEIESLLKEWIQNQVVLAPLFIKNEKAAMVQAHSENLSKLASLALTSMQTGTLNEEDISGFEELSIMAKNEYGGTVLAVVPGLEKLIRSVNPKS